MKNTTRKAVITHSELRRLKSSIFFFFFFEKSLIHVLDAWGEYSNKVLLRIFD